MVAPPQLRLTARRAREFVARGPLAERIARFAKAWMAAPARRARFGEAPPGTGPPVEFHLDEAPPAHSGLGLGTQLGLSVGAALYSLSASDSPRAFEMPTPEVLAPSVGRGERSAVGAIGFCRGGLIYETGKRSGEPLGRLAKRLDLPPEWRFVLFFRPRGAGLSGSREKAAFRNLPPTPPQAIERLHDLARGGLVPAAVSGDFSGFAAALYEYGHLAGMSFAAVQGGAYANDKIVELVQWLRDLGVVGVGQSSWGPTVYAATPSNDEARALVKETEAGVQARGWRAQVARPDNAGAVIASPERSD